MTNLLSANYRIFKNEKGGFDVWKIDGDGNKVEKKNEESYPSRKSALPYLRKLYSVMPKSEASEQDAPNYHEVYENDNGSKVQLDNTCLTCHFFIRENCVRYDFDAKKNYTCDSWLGAHEQLPPDLPQEVLDKWPSPQTDKSYMQSNLVLGQIQFTADEDNPQILRFKDAVLARAETNKNGDTVDAKGIKELANTIAGRPIDLDHDPKKNVGVFTAGRVGENNELLVDGMIWTDRCEAFGITADEVVRRGMSIEANAETAECSVCHNIFTEAALYCDHLKHKIKAGAQRILKGLRAVGGASTPRPAGSGTGFGNAGIVFLASHQLEEEEVDTNFVQVGDATGISSVPYITTTSSGTSQMWITANPSLTIETVRAEIEATIEEKIKRAGKKYGIEFSEQEINMSDELDKDKVDSPAEEKKESDAEKKAENEESAEYMAVKKDLETMTAKLEASQTALEAAQKEVKELSGIRAERDDYKGKYEAAVLDHKTAQLKSKLVGSVLDEAEFEADKEMYLNMSDKAIEKLVAVATKKPASEPMRINAAETSVGDEPRKLY